MALVDDQEVMLFFQKAMLFILVAYILTILEWTFKELGINTRNLIDSVKDGDCWGALVNAERDPTSFVRKIG